MRGCEAAVTFAPGVEVCDEDSWELSRYLKGCSYVAFLDGCYSYGSHFLQDLLNATRYAADATAWGVASDGARFVECENILMGASMHCLARALPQVEYQNTKNYAIDTDQFSTASNLK